MDHAAESSAMRHAAACAFLLLFAACCVADEAKPPRAILLTARADLPDPRFRNAIVLVMNNVAEGPVGLILNRPTPVGVARVFPELERLAAMPERVYFGGPVDPGAVSFVFRAAKPPDHAIPVVDDICFSSDKDLLRELLERDDPMQGLRIFAGYAGWGRGQLENEIARGDWTLENATPEAIFRRRPEHPWPERKAPDDELRG
jgi:putative transcriptional regulator